MSDDTQKLYNRIAEGERSFFLVSGPCVIETEDIVFSIASRLKSITEVLEIPFIFKASFDKANRSSIESYRGPGLGKGLDILRRVKEELGVPILTDFHLPSQAEMVSGVADILQIPAFLCRQTDMLVAAGETGKIVNVKKGQFLAPWDMKNAVQKIESTGNRKIVLTERGSSFGYNNLVVDFKSFPVMSAFGYPVLFDATHSVQLPGGLGNATGGQREFIPALAKAAAGLGVSGFFFEVHEHPEEALSDGPNLYPLDQFSNLLRKLLSIWRAGADVETD
ncbi:MAG: 3-deoxy-8-phosphooctulonate synthase [Acidobacteria bacterium]|nr:MAG: 3-deoxy-8-phosphooctulonate synthase [Acidobacteriota bacterium]RLE24591.1 MAG: 3-deoxy-8-phosphooctulonate synthase [Acidobacteriota bacterium]